MLIFEGRASDKFSAVSRKWHLVGGGSVPSESARPQVYSTRNTVNIFEDLVFLRYSPNFFLGDQQSSLPKPLMRSVYNMWLSDHVTFWFLCTLTGISLGDLRSGGFVSGIMDSSWIHCQHSFVHPTGSAKEGATESRINLNVLQYWKVPCATEEMAQRLRALGVIVEVLDSVPSSHIVAHNCQ